MTISATRDPITQPSALLLELRAEWIWKTDSYAIHFAICYARQAGRTCNRCLHLEAEATVAEDLYTASGGTP